MQGKGRDKLERRGLKNLRTHNDFRVEIMKDTYINYEKVTFVYKRITVVYSQQYSIVYFSKIMWFSEQSPYLKIQDTSSNVSKRFMKLSFIMWYWLLEKDRFCPLSSLVSLVLFLRKIDLFLGACGWYSMIIIVMRFHFYFYVRVGMHSWWTLILTWNGMITARTICYCF